MTSHLLLNGNALHIPLSDNSVHMVATSPPYWALRDYGVPGQIGLESLPDCLGWARGENCGKCYVCVTRLWAAEVWRVLRDDGTFWLNLGSSYAGNGKGSNKGRENSGLKGGFDNQESFPLGRDKIGYGLKPKDLIGIPWRVALALQADGWYLRSDIIWAKPNPIPESVSDRPTKSHEYIFLLTKRARYYYDAEAVKEPNAISSGGWQSRALKGNHAHGNGEKAQGNGAGGVTDNVSGRNLRSVWTVATQPYSGARSVADYVGDDGKPYIASLDCPIHGHLADSRRNEMGFRGGRLTQIEYRSYGKYTSLDEVLSSEPLSNLSHSAPLPSNSGSPALEISRTQTNENRVESRMKDDRPSPTSDERISDRTNHKSKSYGPAGRKLDLLARANSEIAILHSKRSRKKGHASVTTPAYTSSSQTSFHTGDIEESPVIDENTSHTQTNNTSGASVLDGPEIGLSEQTLSRTVGIATFSYDDYTCTCLVVSTDHFATWPEALVEPMILAGTSAKGCCPECGKPWKREVERERVKVSESKRYSGNGDRNDSEDGRSETSVKTLGWRSGCAHDLLPVPCLILDPFCGSGTTGRVAIRHNRRFIGIDLNSEYLNLAVKRLDVQPVLI